MTPRSWLAAGLVATTLGTSLAPQVARAQSAQDKAAAEAAFEEGKKLMAAHAYADACPKLAESQRLDPGIGTMLGLADCYEKNGQTASSWAEFKEAAAAAARKSDKREALARANAARVEPLLSKLVIHVGPEADLQGLTVKRDGLEVGRPSWGEAVPLDPGVHAIAASAPSKKEWTSTITVNATAGTQTVAIPALEDAPPPPPVAEVPAPVAPAPAAAPTEPEAPRRDGHAQRIAAVAAGGVGVVGIVVGSIFGLEAKSKLNDSNTPGNCNAADQCTPNGSGLRQDAESAARISTGAFIVGGIGLAAGAVLWFTAPPMDEHPRTAVGLRASPGGLSVVGAW